MIEVKKLEERIRKLENDKALCGNVPGTIVQRVLMDSHLLLAMGISLKGSKETHLIWAIGIGPLQRAKIFGYGFTLGQALTEVEKKCKLAIGGIKSAM